MREALLEQVREVADRDAVSTSAAVRRLISIGLRQEQDQERRRDRERRAADNE